MSKDRMAFEFGSTQRFREFTRDHPTFELAFARLLDVAAMSFEVTQRFLSADPDNPLSGRVCLWLARACMDDFLEVCFLAANGHGSAATKMLRGLFERAVTLEYIRQHPDKAIRFRDYSAVQEHKLMQQAFDAGVSEQAWTERNLPNPEAVRAAYQRVRQEFQITACKECDTKRLASSWDKMDVVSLAKRLGGSYVALIVPAYAMPTLALHATLASAVNSGLANDEGWRRTEADSAASTVKFAMVLLMLVLKSLAQMSTESLASQLGECDKLVFDMWNDPKVPGGRQVPADVICETGANDG